MNSALLAEICEIAEARPKWRFVNPISWLASRLFPVQPLRMECGDLRDSLGYIDRLSRDGIEPLIDHTRVWNLTKSQDGVARWKAADSQPFISGVRLGKVRVGEAKPVYPKGSREHRRAQILG